MKIRSSADNYFKFKQFQIAHDKSSMKVGTDAVLLGAWVDCLHKTNILEIGTGSGVIALMLAQRTGAEIKIDAVEIEEQDALQAKENIDRSPWPSKIIVHHLPFQLFKTTTQYDLIVTNPPFFINSQLPPSPKRSQAKHTQSLTHLELLKHSYPLLSDDGKLAIILPFEEGKLFIATANRYGMHIHRQLAIFARQEKPQERWIFELGKSSPKHFTSESLILLENREDWSEGYKNLAKDFYLKL